MMESNGSIVVSRDHLRFWRFDQLIKKLMTIHAEIGWNMEHYFLKCHKYLKKVKILDESSGKWNKL